MEPIGASRPSGDRPRRTPRRARGWRFGFYLIVPFGLACDPGGEPPIPVTISDPWTRAPAVTTSEVSIALYLTLRNDGPEAIELIGIRSGQARDGMLHETTLRGDIARMRPVASIAVPPGRSVTLKPGSLHGMLRGLDPVPPVGDVLPVTLTFRDGSELSIQVPVRAR